MQTISDIRFDNTIFPPYTKWTLLLYQMNAPGIAIPIPNANLMSFIRPFTHVFDCQNHIGTNNQKQCILFAYGDNFIELAGNSNVIPANLNDIKIFCPPDEYDFIRQWANRFGQVKNIIPYNELNRELLLFGVKYLREARSHFQHDQGVFNLLDADYKRMCATLTASY
jgi:hypothetical protein